jgi:xanthine/CO dehydrogenase XdhC/CoxF family maturation factor
MNHWKETAEILSHVPALAANGRRAALATVVHIVGSAYRRPGAKLLVLDSGETLGSVSGGCLEADVREVAMGVMDNGRPWLRHYDAGEDDDVIGSLALGCNGQVDILVQPVNNGPLVALHEPLTRLLAEDSPLAIATIVTDVTDIGATMAIAFPGGDVTSRRSFGSLGGTHLDQRTIDGATARLADGHSGVERIAGRDVFIEVLHPPPHLLVCGAGADAIPLAGYAADSGFRVTLVDHRQGLLRRSAFPQAYRLVVARPGDDGLVLPPPERTLAVVMTHSLAHDRDWARRLSELDVPYIGVLGPRDRTKRILRDIGGEKTMPGGRGRVFGPVGLDIGADGPHQVAISIVAELLAFVSRREPRHLWQRQQAIHAPRRQGRASTHA